MATFNYTAKDTKGKTISGVLEADNPTAVVGRLQSMGFFPIAIEEEAARGQGLAKLGRVIGRGRIGIGDLSTFDRQMSDLISSGIPLVKALSIIGAQTPNPALKRILETVSNDVSSGDTLAEAMHKHPRVFSPLTVAMVRAGETGGMLENVLQRLADFSEMEEELRGRVKSALAYPAVMLFAGSAAVAVMITVVIPKIVSVFHELNQVLPLPTRILIGTTDFFKSWWWALLGGVVLGVSLLWRFAKTTEGARMIHNALLQLPVLGPVIVKREVARFARTLGELLRNGVPILTAFGIAQKVLTNRIIADEVAKAPDAITQGSGVAPALGASGHFPPMVINMVAIGEETGRLPEALLKVANSYEIQVDRSLKTLTSLLEPLIILVMGLVVGSIVISMLLPIFSLDPTGGR
ncbi:MAG: type II secretion system F family protein [Candidatus Sumerlaeota bacterium]|nr:type II secretion system F family protein [Candidatus Sumerlaeota bacterium]